MVQSCRFPLCHLGPLETALIAGRWPECKGWLTGWSTSSWIHWELLLSSSSRWPVRVLCISPTTGLASCFVFRFGLRLRRRPHRLSVRFRFPSHWSPEAALSLWQYSLVVSTILYILPYIFQIFILVCSAKFINTIWVLLSLWASIILHISFRVLHL